MAGRRPWPPNPTKLGAYDYDEETAAQSRRVKTKADRRKLFAIETRLIPTYSENSIIYTLNLDQWFTHGRYVTKARRDQAYAVLVKKSERELRGWSKTEWRKVG